MTALVWIGAALTVAGLAGLGWCILVALRARRARLEGPEMEARLRGLVAINLGALACSTIGLMMVVLGVFLS
ncbi:hypothetical protein [Jannaschia aquimarina]|uniref:Uncharacterized protein n=1 Tax=Jannaschia aquimarina TaxID=935700 RepID=A0A0D1CQ67_9RHOB|nr:hypothetical protein [Jannaschia aquimarina]KIT16892.1 hypothetical protein jaqu_13910 [Jannaschia aquimarina]SNT12203.1 hypothetical protein SAMN05421775_10657 [Jannaschia aquimarina]